VASRNSGGLLATRLLTTRFFLPDPAQVPVVEVVAELEAVAEDEIYLGVAVEDDPCIQDRRFQRGAMLE